MADTLEIGTPRKLLVEGRAPFADEAASLSDPSFASIAAPDANGDVFVSGLVEGVFEITVAPGSEDVNKTAGTLSVTVTAAPVPPTPLTVSFA